MTLIQKTLTQKLFAVCVCSLFCGSPLADESANKSLQDRQAYFGDLHIHTMYSMDAFMAFGVRTSPDDAYLYAKGEPLAHPSGDVLRMSGPPLDFLMVSDHASYLGVNAALLDPTSPTYGHAETENLVGSTRTLSQAIQYLRQITSEGHELVDTAVISDAWTKSIAAAERHNDPGKFTALIGYEYTPTPGSRHLHRNVVFRGSSVPSLPFSSRDSEDPADLWQWMDDMRSKGMDVLAIPHNMNQSDGLAFMETTWKGQPIDQAFADLRSRNEPVAEITQQKGTSETHPSLSPNDEWADFQIVQYYLNRATNTNPISVFKGGYYRDALLTGLKMQTENGYNPYQLGALGSSDTHVSGGPYEEDAFFTSTPNTPVSRGAAYPDFDNKDASWQDFWTPRQATHGTGGLAGVWAAENTRAALFDGMRRRETFATSGPRIRVRFFASQGFPKGITQSNDLIEQAYEHGVSMGGVLNQPLQTSPEFLVWAGRDPHAGWLQRLQIIKGWVEDGKAKERVYDVACSDGLSPDSETHRCPDNGARVNLSDCSVSREKGAVEMQTLWRDPDFTSDTQAFYYVRVLENPSCRWSTWDAIRSGIAPNPDLPASHQERAWSSPVWYQPNH